MPSPKKHELVAALHTCAGECTKDTGKFKHIEALSEEDLARYRELLGAFKLRCELVAYGLSDVQELLTSLESFIEMLDGDA